MGGRITVESEPGRGSRFRFSARFAVATGPSRAAASRLPARLRGLRVLVVDDNATNRHILEEVLTQWRMRPTAVAGARAALEEMEAADREGRPYPLMLLDANMPVMDGFDLAAKVQQSPRLAGASIMMLSSGARPGDRARCFELGISAYLTKPVKQSDLMDTIMGVLVSRSEERKARPRKEAARLPPGGRRLRVLVAEDNAVNQQVAAGMLERAGHEAVVAANGREALALLEKEAFDLVLMDVQMPELDGLETTAAIRERERVRGGHLPIVAVTAHAMKGDAERCLAAGMDGYVAKPLQPRELEAAIARVIAPERADARLRRPRPVPAGRGRRLPAPARARRRRPQGAGPARPDLPDGLAEAGGADPQGPQRQATRPPCARRPTRSRGRCRTSPPRPPRKRPCACSAWATPATSRGRRVRSTGWSGRSAGCSRHWPRPRRDRHERRRPSPRGSPPRNRFESARRPRPPGRAAAAEASQSRYFTNTTSLWASL